MTIVIGILSFLFEGKARFNFNNKTTT